MVKSPRFIGYVKEFVDQQFYELVEQSYDYRPQNQKSRAGIKDIKARYCFIMPGVPYVEVFQAERPDSLKNQKVGRKGQVQLLSSNTHVEQQVT